MTREEIIEQLDGIIGTYEILIGNGVNSDILNVDDIEAIREAISVLSAEPCEDCISRNAVLDNLSELLSDWDDDYNVPLIKAIGRVEDSPSVNLQEPQTAWIPVSEGLPEPWASVLITFSGKYDSLVADHAVGTGSYDGEYGWFIDEIQGYTDRLTVSAWMNLPESYKGE